MSEQLIVTLTNEHRRDLHKIGLRITPW